MKHTTSRFCALGASMGEGMAYCWGKDVLLSIFADNRVGPMQFLIRDKTVNEWN
jgi:hypothetical protein